MVRRKPGILLTGPGISASGESCTYGETVNGGATWSARFPFKVDLADLPIDAEFRLWIKDEGGECRSVPLVAFPRSTSRSIADGESTDLRGIDRESFMLSRKNLSLPSFRNTDSLAVLGAVSQEVGVQITGAESFPFLDEDVKEAHAWDPILRAAAVAAQDWINNDGQIQLVSPTFSVGGYEYPADLVTRTTDGSQRYTSLSGAKGSRIGAGTVEGGEVKTSFIVPFEETGPKTFAFPNPLSFCIPYDMSESGFVSSVALWQGDPARGGKLITYWDPYGTPSNVPQTGSWPATHGSCIVGPPSLPGIALNARLLIKGSPPPSTTIPGLDTQFVEEYDTGLQPKRPAPMWDEQLIPGRAWFLAKAPNRLRQLNRGCDGLAINCPLWLPVTLTEIANQPGFPAARVESFLHTVGVGDVSTRINASISILQ